jgi:hypothetical protein
MKFLLLLHLPANIALLGSLLLLFLATTTIATFTLAQQDCDPTAAAAAAAAAIDENAVLCDEDVSYCSNTSKTCIAIGSCADNNVIDCQNINNAPYPALLCMGTMECKDGMCLMNCGMIMEEDDPTSTSTSTTIDEIEDNTGNNGISSCMTSSECNNNMSNMNNMDMNMNMNMNMSMNTNMSMSMSMSNMDEMGDMGGGGGSMMMDGEYCGSDSTCMLMGDCLIIDDCTMNMDNIFPVAACMVSL